MKFLQKIEKLYRKLFKKEVLCELRKVEKELAYLQWKIDLICNHVYDITALKQSKGALRDFQLKVVLLLRSFHEICEDNGISFWPCFGTCLGAYRHKGFVPWDDDCDVGLLKNDFDRLMLCGDMFEKRGIRLINWWVPGRMARVVFAELEGPFIDIIAFEDDGKFIKAMPPWGGRNSFPCPREYVMPLKMNELQFEGITLNGPRNIENYLRFYYGNYMNFPARPHAGGGHAIIDEYSVKFK